MLNMFGCISRQACHYMWACHIQGSRKLPLLSQLARQLRGFAFRPHRTAHGHSKPPQYTSPSQASRSDRNQGKKMRRVLWQQRPTGDLSNFRLTSACARALTTLLATHLGQASSCPRSQSVVQSNATNLSIQGLGSLQRTFPTPLGISQVVTDFALAVRLETPPCYTCECWERRHV